MIFEKELDEVLPGDLPHRELLIHKAAIHLALIQEANRAFNLTRIVNARDAAIKHVLDSVSPWRLFPTDGNVLDAGTGAGFPGVPLALALPGVAFHLADSTQKKARFVEQAIATMDLPNVRVSAERAETLLLHSSATIIIARAVAPLTRAVPLFAPAIRRGASALLYKGPDAEQEIADATRELTKARIAAAIAMRYELPEGCGSRTVVQLTASR